MMLRFQHECLRERDRHAARSSSGDGCRRRRWRSPPPLWKRSNVAFLWRAIAVPQTRRIVIDGPLPPESNLSPWRAIVTLTRGSPKADAASVIDADPSYNFVSRESAGTVIEPAPWLLMARARTRNREFCAHLQCGLDGNA